MLQSADKLIPHKTDDGRFMVIEYEVHGTILATAGQGADLIHWPAESFMMNARQWIYYGGGTAVIGVVLILLARR